MTATIQPHNERPAKVWSSGGAAYDEISRQIASALDHCVRRLAPQQGERILDLATGTGWTARLTARHDAEVNPQERPNPPSEVPYNDTGSNI